jgi:diguanylate cyclase (GGDEF)-like protein
VARRSSETLGVVTIDLDRFKQVNDTHGHAAGDELVVAVTDRLLAGSREGDLVARLGGDEFAILCAQATMAGMSDFCSRTTRALAEPFDLTYGQVFVGASAGVSLVVGGEYEPIEVMRQADLAMYRAKDEGRGRHAFFELEMDQAFRSRQALEADLRKALADGDLTVLYQPQIDQRGRMFGVEALARWNHPVHGPISPSKFVPLAEECGLIEALGRFTLHRAFMDSLAWPRLTVAVNVSAVQLRGSGLPNLLTELLAETGADPRRIELEITEGILMTDDVQTHQLLARIRAMGFSLALDDFGTGYSSLSYLRRYPVDKIKIDRSFISNLGVDDDAEAVVEAIVRLAKALQLKVMGEGVETAAQRTSLLKAGCGSFQGFLYSRPIEFDMVEPLLAGRATERAA